MQWNVTALKETPLKVRISKASVKQILRHPTLLKTTLLNECLMASKLCSTAFNIIQDTLESFTQQDAPTRLTCRIQCWEVLIRNLKFRFGWAVVRPNSLFFLSTQPDVTKTLLLRYKQIYGKKKLETPNKHVFVSHDLSYFFSVKREMAVFINRLKQEMVRFEL